MHNAVLGLPTAICWMAALIAIFGGFGQSIGFEKSTLDVAIIFLQGHDLLTFDLQSSAGLFAGEREEIFKAGSSAGLGFRFLVTQMELFELCHRFLADRFRAG